MYKYNYGHKVKLCKPFKISRNKEALKMPSFMIRDILNLPDTEPLPSNTDLPRDLSRDVTREVTRDLLSSHAGYRTWTLKRQSCNKNKMKVRTVFTEIQRLARDHSHSKSEHSTLVT